mgnify:CR=1 FL=1
MATSRSKKPVTAKVATNDNVAELSSVKDQLVQAQNEISKLKTAVEEISKKSSSSNIDIGPLEQKLNLLQDQILDLASRANSSQQQPASFAKKVEALEIFARTSQPKRWDYAKKRAKV